MVKKPDRKPPGPAPSPDSFQVTFSVKITKRQLEAIEAAAAASGKPPRVWARDKMLRGLKIRPR